MAKILIVEDDQILASSLTRYLKAERNVVEVANDGITAEEYLRALVFDAIVLDWELPGKQGIEICRNFRTRGGRTPILFLTGRKETVDKIVGLDSGAEDYLTKPVQLAELAARLRALMRRGTDVKELIHFRDLIVDVTARTVHRNNQSIDLLPMQFDLLLLLLRNKDHTVSRDMIASKVWKDEYTSSTTISKTVSRLREKVEHEGERPLIAAIKGIGYRLEA